MEVALLSLMAIKIFVVKFVQKVASCQHWQRRYDRLSGRSQSRHHTGSNIAQVLVGERRYQRLVCSVSPTDGLNIGLVTHPTLPLKQVVVVLDCWSATQHFNHFFTTILFNKNHKIVQILQNIVNYFLSQNSKVCVCLKWETWMFHEISSVYLCCGFH